MRWEWAASRERRRIAVHESSHAVAAILCGGDAHIRLNVRRYPDGLYNFDGLTVCRNHPRHDGFIAGAGVIGEAVYCSSRGQPAPPQRCWASDLRAMARDDHDAVVERAAVALGTDAAIRDRAFGRCTRWRVARRRRAKTGATRFSLHASRAGRGDRKGRGAGGSWALRRVSASSRKLGGSISPSALGCRLRLAARCANSKRASPPTPTGSARAQGKCASAHR